MSDYWIVDVEGRRFEVLRKPEADGDDATRLRLAENETVAWLERDDAVVVRALLPYLGRPRVGRPRARALCPSAQSTATLPVAADSCSDDDMARVRSIVSAAALVGATGCGSVRYTTEYVSTVRHEPLPLRSTVTVLVSPELRDDMDDEPTLLEALRQTYQSALRRDLERNGPLKPVVEDPEARLQVMLHKVRTKEVPLALMTWFLAPTWLFGVPYHWARVELSADIQLTSAWGDVLYRSTMADQCSRLRGLYYGRDDLSFGCPGQRIAEALRERLSLDRSDILARLTTSRSRAVRARSVAFGRPAPPAGGDRLDSKPLQRVRPIAAKVEAPKEIAAVFNIRDMSGQFSERVLEQLTEYLSARIAAKLGLKIVPREEIRRRLIADKRDSYRACYDESCQIDVGKALAANKSVSTTLLRVGGRCAFTSTVYDLRTEAADYAASVQMSCEEDELLDGVDRVVEQLGNE